MISDLVNKRRRKGITHTSKCGGPADLKIHSETFTFLRQNLKITRKSQKIALNNGIFVKIKIFD